MSSHLVRPRRVLGSRRNDYVKRGQRKGREGDSNDMKQKVTSVGDWRCDREKQGMRRKVSGTAILCRVYDANCAGLHERDAKVN